MSYFAEILIRNTAIPTGKAQLPYGLCDFLSGIFQFPDEIYTIPIRIAAILFNYWQFLMGNCAISYGTIEIPTMIRAILFDNSGILAESEALQVKSQSQTSAEAIIYNESPTLRTKYGQCFNPIGSI